MFVMLILEMGRPFILSNRLLLFQSDCSNEETELLELLDSFQSLVHLDELFFVDVLAAGCLPF